MAKSKRKGKPFAGKREKKELPEKVNPFEIKVNRQKHKVLGRKLAKHDVGMPGLSRFKATQKRADTLLVEYKKRWKSGQFIDKRFAENDPTLSLEDKMLQRFAMEKQKHYENAGKLSLNEEEELTHYGQSLADIEKFDEAAGSSDDEGKGKISAKQVASEHFGGGVLSSTQEQSNKSWKERMEEVIMQSKKAKYERQMEKEKVQDMTEKLDSQWKELRNLISSSQQKLKKDVELPAETKDSYDAMVRLLKFESRGHATDRLKSEEELAKEEKAKLEKLEKDRIRRMRGLVEDIGIPTLQHRSADDLDDGFSQEPNKERFHVSYKDGTLLAADALEERNKSGSEAEDTGDDSADSEYDEDGNENESDNETDRSDVEEHGVGDHTEGSDAENEPDNDGEEGDGDADNNSITISDKDDASDVLTISDDEPEATRHCETAENVKQKSVTADIVLCQNNADSVSDSHSEHHGVAKGDDTMHTKNSSSKNFASVLQARKAMMDAARQELPYTYDVPSSYADLASLLCDYSAADQLTILARMRKCNHESLAEGNKKRLLDLFGLLLEYFGDVALQDPLPETLIEGLAKHLSELNKLDPASGATHVLEMLAQRQTLFSQYCRGRGGVGPWPRMDVLMMFKLTGILYPTSDFYHPVVTPTMIFMSQIFGQCPIKTYRDVVSSLFMASIAYEYISFAKRYIPELLNLLNSVIYLATPTTAKPELDSMQLPLPTSGSGSDILVCGEVTKMCDNAFLKMSRLSAKGTGGQVPDDEKLAAVLCAVELLNKLSELWRELPAYKEVFATTLQLVQNLSTGAVPQQIMQQLGSLIHTIEMHSSSQRDYLCLQKKKPKPLKTFEPAFEEVYDGRKKIGGDRAFNEKQRLIYKHKKELKGAMREVRKDAHYLAQHRLQEQMQRDADRKRKVKEIYQMLSQQEGDFRALKRGKPNKK